MTRNLFHNYYRTDTARAQWHDYNAGAFFITICTANREPYFGTISNKKMYYSDLGHIAQECINKMETLHTDITIPIFQIMPDHIHFIIHVAANGDSPTDVVNDGDVESPYSPKTDMTESTGTVALSTHMRDVANRCGRLSHVISRFKCALTKYARNHNIPFQWQSRFYDRIIRDEFEWEHIAWYIKYNVANWKIIDDTNPKFMSDIMEELSHLKNTSDRRQ